MEYFVNAGSWGAVFAVPNAVVDNYIKLANEASLKVLLYILRNNGKKLASDEAACALNLNINQIEEAFIFWENANILKRDEKPLISSSVSEPVSEEKIAAPVKKSSIPSGTGYSLKPSEIAQRVENSEDVRVMFNMAEASFGRPLNHTEQRSFIWMHDYLGLSGDVLITIAAYCISIEKGSIKYIETLASDWSEKGINTLELVQDEIKAQEEKNTFNGRIMKAFGMTRRPTAKQQELIDSWKKKGYSLELIEYAYEKTIEAIDKLNFPYINKVLENWYSQGLITKAKIDGGNNKRNARTERESEHSYDLNELKSFVNNFGDK
mgnify:FL=1